MTLYTGSVAMRDFQSALVAHMIAEGWQETRVPVSVVPPNTAASTPAPYIASATVTAATNFDAWRAFDGLRSGNGYRTGTGTTASLRIHLGASNNKVVNRYVVTCADTVNTAPRDWFFEGSQDGTTWTILDTRTNQTGWAVREARAFDAVNTVAWQHYQLRVTAANGGTVLEIAELDLLDMEAGQPRFFESVMRSTGSSGTDNIIVTIHPHNSRDFRSNHLLVGYAEQFNNQTLLFTNKYERLFHFANSATPNLNPSNGVMQYFAEVSRDRVVFVTLLDPSATSAATSATYLGLIRRYAAEADSSAQCLGFSMMAPAGGMVLLRNRSLALHQTYTSRVVAPAAAPSAWGDLIFASPICLEGTSEGMRGELEGMLIASPSNIVTGDEVVVGTQRYRAIVTTVWLTNSFPNNCMLLPI